jgi:hypothetical protein
MPIEIRELVVRSVVSDDTPAPTSSGSGRSDDAPAATPVSTEQLVQECVRQVLLALARERER